MSAVIFSGSYIKALKSKMKLGTATTDAWFDNLSADPTVTAVSAPAGSLAFYNGTVYIKQDAGSTTAWKAVTKLPGVLFYDHAEFGLVSKFTTGKNTTTFLSGGALGGALTRSTTAGDLIEGTAVYKYVANATPANSVGDYIADAAWTVPLGRRGVENYSLGTYSWSGAAAEAYFVAYDPTTGNTIQWELEPTGSSGSRDFSFPWSIASSSTTMRYGFWIKSLATGSSTLRWSPVTFETSTSANAVTNVNNMEPWTSYTPTGLWTTNATYTGRWRRVGDQMEIEAKVSLSGAPTVAGSLYFNIPSGYTIDTTKLVDTSTNHAYLGIGTILDAGTQTYQAFSFYRNTTSVLVSCSVASGTYTTNGTGVNQTVPITFGSGDEVTLRFSVPILGWAASVESVITPSKVMDPVIYSTNTAQNITTATVTIVDFEDVENDTESHVTTGASWKFTVKRSGWYKVTSNVVLDETGGTPTWHEANSAFISLYKNGSEFRRCSNEEPDYTGNKRRVNLAGNFPPVYLNVGEYIDIRVYHNASGTIPIGFAAQKSNYVSIEALNSYPSIAQPVSRIGYVYYQTAFNVGGGSLVSGWTTHSLNTTSGDTSFFTLASNQITLIPGTYRVRIVQAFKNAGGNVQSAFATPSGSYYVTTNGGYSNSSTETTTCIGENTITITTATAFERRSYSAGGSGDSEASGPFKLGTPNGCQHHWVSIEKLR